MTEGLFSPKVHNVNKTIWKPGLEIQIQSQMKLISIIKPRESIFNYRLKPAVESTLIHLTRRVVINDSLYCFQLVTWSMAYERAHLIRFNNSQSLYLSISNQSVELVLRPTAVSFTSTLTHQCVWWNILSEHTQLRFLLYKKKKHFNV